jgi:hypothetical protein
MATSHIVDSGVDFLLQISPRIRSQNGKVSIIAKYRGPMRNRFLSQHRKIHVIGSPFEENIPPNHSRELEFSKEKINSNE